MRGTASHDLVFDGVYLAAEKVVGKRPYGELGGPCSPRRSTSRRWAGRLLRRRAPAPATRPSGGWRARASPRRRRERQVGEMRAQLRVARWGLLGDVAEIGDDPRADEATLATVMPAKRHAVLEARAVVDPRWSRRRAATTGRHRWSGPPATCAAARSTR